MAFLGMLTLVVALMAVAEGLQHVQSTCWSGHQHRRVRELLPLRVHTDRPKSTTATSKTISFESEIGDGASKKKEERGVIPRVRAPMPEGRRPDWFHVPAPSSRDGQKFEKLRTSIKDLDLHTVCEEAQCPNIGEC